MSKKISTIFLTLFLVGVLSVSCSNADKTGAGDGSTTTKGIEQYNGNTYVSTKSYTVPQLGTGYLWISVKDSKFAMNINNNNTDDPVFYPDSYFTVTSSGTDYTFSIPNSKGTPDQVQGTLKFSDTSVTVRFTKNADMSSIVGQDIVCNIKK